MSQLPDKMAVIQLCNLYPIKGFEQTNYKHISLGQGMCLSLSLQFTICFRKKAETYTIFMKDGLDGKKMLGKSEGATRTPSFRALKRAPGGLAEYGHIPFTALIQTLSRG